MGLPEGMIHGQDEAVPVEVLRAGAGVVDGVVQQIGEAVLVVLDALPAGGGAHPEVGAEDGLEPGPRRSGRRRPGR